MENITKGQVQRARKTLRQSSPHERGACDHRGDYPGGTLPMIFAQPIAFAEAHVSDVRCQLPARRALQLGEMSDVRSRRLIFASELSFSDPAPFDDAAVIQEIKSLLPTDLSSAELEAIAPEIL